MMKKGVTVAQVAQVADGFTRAGIMVHAYLMYGFPTETDQETIDSLEMVRQLFEAGVLQSGFWHRFAMTAHSPVGLEPAKFEVARTGPDFGGFADNDLYHDDPAGADHDLFSEGLRKSLFNYMHGMCLDFPLQEWFDHDVPETSIPSGYIEQCLHDELNKTTKQNAIVVWLGNIPELTLFEIKKGSKKIEMAELEFFDKKKDWQLHTTAAHGQWIAEIMPSLIISEQTPTSYKDLVASFENATGAKFEDFSRTKTWFELRENGLLIL
jgi:hypothetical protein